MFRFDFHSLRHLRAISPSCAVQVFADGVGSVTYDSPNDARAAANGMNGYMVEGLQLRVRQE